MRSFRITVLIGLFLLSAATLFTPDRAAAQANEDCLTCHEDPELTGQRNGREFSAYVNPQVFARSVHAEVECIQCHTYLEGAEEFPHDALKPEPVDCGGCHDDVAKLYVQSLHGQAVAAGEALAPQCWDCHGAHDVVAHDQPDSRVAKYNIPFMCGTCHKEGAPVTRKYDIPQDSILDHYSFSVHGEGLYKKGLTVSAVCTDCHTAHFVLPHTDVRSSIHRDNVAATCQKCHGRIEQVHQKVIRGELWEKEPNKVPVCVDCHEPHKVRKVFYQEVSDQECLKCHARPDLSMQRDGITVSLCVDSLTIHSSIHHGQTCAQCHTNTSPSLHRPCATVADRVDCGICHTEVVQLYATSMHGKLLERGDPDAPRCTDCHGDHAIRNRQDRTSATFPINVPALCARCHVSDGPAARRRVQRGEAVEADVYPESIHGMDLLQGGLVVTAMCTDCHTAHHVLPRRDPVSSVNSQNIPRTCAKCHEGVYEQYVASIHSPEVSDSDDPLPSCADCHKSHAISRTDMDDFRQQIANQCGGCHKDVTDTYFDTYHGKVSQLGGAGAAKCHDCHGSHDILPTDNAKSHLSRQNIVATCGKCHASSHRQFAGYLTHATHHDRDKYPALYYTFWFMTILLVGTLTGATLHTILWLPRSFQAMRRHRELSSKYRGNLVFRRFSRQQSILHILMVISFLGLAVTGMTLKFSYLRWAQWLSELLGGFESAGYIHRVCATITAGYFLTHVYTLVRNKIRTQRSWLRFLLHPDSMLPNRNDLKEFWGTLKWFVGLGPRPEYGRWTYWEKFDYFAVFWGVAVIGSTGLMLWFPEFFTLILPGWFINVATIIHSDEALLAAAFIFTVHFFNTHFRPDKFPIDTVIFTGRVPLEEFKFDRPREYRELMASGKLGKHMEKPILPASLRAARIFGTAALLVGLGLIVLIIYAEVFGYR